MLLLDKYFECDAFPNSECQCAVVSIGMSESCIIRKSFVNLASMTGIGC